MQLQIINKKLVESCIVDPPEVCPSVFSYKNVLAENSCQNTPPTIPIFVTKLVLEWVKESGGVDRLAEINAKKSIRLVRGSHIITKKLYNEDVAFTLQNDDNRIVFVTPYKQEFSLIGTTEVDVNTPDNPSISDDEKIYLINTINNHFIKQISQEDIVDTYSGIRPLIEDFKEASKVTRDYVFDLSCENNKSPLLNIYGGKLTTYRKLSEKVMEELSPYLPDTKIKNWTASKRL